MAKRHTTLETLELMDNLAKLSEDERNRILTDFYDEVFGGLDIDPAFEEGLRSVRAELPDDPSPEQVEAWIELAELVRDPAFRRRVREMSEAHAAVRRAGQELEASLADGFELVVAEHAGAALAAGVDPRSAEAAAVLVPIVDALRSESPDSPELRAATADRIAMGNDIRVERYWQLLGTVNGWEPFPSVTPAFRWTLEALRAHPRRP